MTKPDEIAELARKLDKLLEKNNGAEPHIFDDDEVAKIQRLMLFLDRVESLGFFAKYAFYGLLTCGAIIANWERISSWWKAL